jgi:hypothetical protein
MGVGAILVLKNLKKKTSFLSNEIVKRTPKSHETIHLTPFYITTVPWPDSLFRATRFNFQAATVLLLVNCRLNRT